MTNVKISLTNEKLQIKFLFCYGPKYLTAKIIMPIFMVQVKGRINGK